MGYGRGTKTGPGRGAHACAVMCIGAHRYLVIGDLREEASLAHMRNNDALRAASVLITRDRDERRPEFLSSSGFPKLLHKNEHKAHSHHGHCLMYFAEHA